ncbi:MAG: hypothetical protein Q7R45_01365 [Sulfuricaulis sp.]|nr:hypothetical protein [Sulfuricaulis sp.]
MPSRFDFPRRGYVIVDLLMPQAVIAKRYDILARCARSLKLTSLEERAALRRRVPPNAWALQIVYAMRHGFLALWDRFAASREQLVKQRQDWFRRAEASDILPLAEFSRRLRSYV